MSKKEESFFDGIDLSEEKTKTKEEVKRTYECVIKDCGKAYGFSNKF